jgi:hypothetical protein
MPDGSAIKLPDSGLNIVEWDLSFTALTDEEAEALRQFFLESEGDLLTFGFLDPVGNLLAWSEDPQEAPWQTDAMLSVSGSIADPFGGEGACLISNSTTLSRGLRQTVEAPANYQYSLSVWARSSVPTAVRLSIGSNGRECAAENRWRRLSTVASPGTEGSTVDFGASIDPGRSVELFGFQAEAQAAPSGYKRTGPTGGIFSSARFRDSVLSITTNDFNSHSCRVRIVSNANSL